MFTQVLFNNISISFHNALLGLVNPKIELNHFRLNINWHDCVFLIFFLIWNPIYFLWSCFAPKRKERLLFQIWPRASNSQWLIWQTPQLLRSSWRNWKEILHRAEIFSNIFNYFQIIFPGPVSPQCQTVWGSFRKLIPTPGILQMFKCPILFILLWCWRSWHKKSAENLNWSCQTGLRLDLRAASLMGEWGGERLC